jgi:hypothetical protein
MLRKNLRFETSFSKLQYLEEIDFSQKPKKNLILPLLFSLSGKGSKNCSKS